MKMIIVGKGLMIYFLAKRFVSKGFEVTVICDDPGDAKYFARNLRVVVIDGDGSDPDILHDAGAHITDFLLAVTDKDQNNLVVSEIAKQHFHIPHILSLVNDPDNEIVFDKLGLKAVSTTNLLIHVIEQMALTEQMTNMLPVAEGLVNLSELILSEQSPVVGMQLKDIVMPEDSLIACLVRGEKPIIPRGNTTLQAKDKLIVVTLPDNHAQVLRLLTDQN